MCLLLTNSNCLFEKLACRLMCEETITCLMLWCGFLQKQTQIWELSTGILKEGNHSPKSEIKPLWLKTMCTAVLHHFHFLLFFEQPFRIMKHYYFSINPAIFLCRANRWQWKQLTFKVTLTIVHPKVYIVLFCQRNFRHNVWIPCRWAQGGSCFLQCFPAQVSLSWGSNDKN